MSNKVKMIFGVLVLVIVLTTMIASAAFAASPGWSGNASNAPAYCGQGNCGAADGGTCDGNCSGTPGKATATRGCGGSCWGGK